MKWFRSATRVLIWIWLVGAVCFSAFFLLAGTIQLKTHN